MSGYKTAIGFLKHLSTLAKDQDMEDCTDWHKLSPKEKEMFYEILAGIQNDLSDIQMLFDGRNSGIEIYRYQS